MDFIKKFESVRSHFRLLDSLLNKLNPKIKNSTKIYSFRPLQIQTLNACLLTDTMAILPTGYGKSLIFQILPYLFEEKKAIILASPLNSIIKEQIENLGEEAILVNEQLIKSLGENILQGEQRELIERLKCGRFSYLVGHPEQLTSSKIKSLLSSPAVASIISHIVIDEAHCIVSWGQSDFRPAFIELRSLRACLPTAKVLTLTATATRKVQEEIADVFDMKDYACITYSPDRSNIFLEVRKRPPLAGGENTAESSVDSILEPLVERLREKEENFPKTLVYLPLKWCGYGHDLASRILGTESGPIAQYHAPQSETMKEEIRKQMTSTTSKLRLLFATEAYSMGTDAPDIESIIHVGPPSSIETYTQEIGRAGRDGRSAKAILYFNNSDISNSRQHLDQSMRDFCLAPTCRRKFIANYFGQVCEVTCAHNCCDNCARQCTCSHCAVHANELDVIPQLIPVAAKQLLQNILLSYFEKENELLLKQCVVPEAVTGLTDKLAGQLANEFLKYSDFYIFKMSYPFLKDSYLENIYSILTKVKNQYC